MTKEPEPHLHMGEACYAPECSPEADEARRILRLKENSGMNKKTTVVLVVEDTPVRSLTPKQEEQFVRDCWDNFPESAISMECVAWKYKDFVFRFVDHEEDPPKVYTVDLPMAIKGFRRFVHAVDTGKLPGLGIPAGYLDPEEGPGILDAGAFDCMLQFSTLGEVIYG